MTTLEIILIAIIWIAYGIFNSYQHNWYDDEEFPEGCVIVTIVSTPIAFIIRFFRGIFFWKGRFN